MNQSDTIQTAHIASFFALADDVFAALSLDDADAASRTRELQVLVTGDFQSNRYGKFSITESDVDQMIENFKSKYPVPPTELAGDYEHLSMDPRAPGDGKASMWFKALTKRASTAFPGKIELWATVEFTPPAAQAVKQKEYRFFSPTFVKNYITNTGKKIGATLLGGALTNRPFLQGMAAVTLSMDGEVAVPVAPQPKRNAMKTITLKDANGNDVTVALNDVLSHDDVKAAAPKPEPKADTQTPQEFVALNATVNALMSTVTSLSESIKADREQRSKERAAEAVDALVRAGKVLPAEKDSWIGLAEHNFDTFKTLSNTLPVKVKMRTEHGAQGTAVIADNATAADVPTPGDDAIKMFDDAVDAVRKEDKSLTYDAAIGKVAKDQPDLAKAYRLSYRQQ